MSIAATNATYARMGELRDLLQTVPARRRPSFQNCALVALLLADRLRQNRSHVDETVGQIACVLTLTEGTVRNCLAALDTLGWWVPEAKGNHHRGTLRKAQLISEHREADHTEQHSEADHTPLDDEHREVGTPASRGEPRSIARYGAQHREADLTTPRVTPSNPSSSSEDEELVFGHLTAHESHQGHLWVNRVAVRTRARTEMRSAIRAARTNGLDPLTVLEANWPTTDTECDYESEPRSFVPPLPDPVFEFVDSADPHAGPTVVEVTA